ncbi:DnaJ domain-containing protein [Pelagibacterium lacus]|uniref:Molecular chaperone DnaJ n=1 Tax=Pelagibacterium lacus TaxID=2282655 RepID=A0A369W609_9HYPH|nr:DnaJ domain-containing protein [Pelagibacterium lacus]RDE09988.1 molecular chaperone DnaJ [Pelagibacterium lacus]
MIWWLAAGAAAGFGLYLLALFMSGEIRKLVRMLRWVVGGGMVAGALFLALRGQMMLASLLGAGGLGVLMRARLGPIDFGAGMSSPHNSSTVRSRFFAMRLEHETGQVEGGVLAGRFKGRDLAELSAEECWELYNEVAEDPDSLALYRSWLDVNRAGWQDYFTAQFGMEAEDDEPSQQSGGAAVGSVAEAYEVLGLKPGASREAIRAAHRALMKKVHPDAGGSAFLAARINQAKDLLLRQAGGQ